MFRLGCSLGYTIFVCLILNACSSTTTTPPPTEPSISIDSIELYVSRRSFSSTDFEQFKLFGDKLFVECGSVVRGHQKPAFQKLYNLDKDQNSSIHEFSSDALGTYALNKPLLDQPGDNSGMADPGQFYLTIVNGSQKTELKTSVDFVSTPSTPIGRKLRRIAEALRAAPRIKICGFQSFYGLN